MSRRFLVIGSNSFSGAQFIKYLLQRRHNVLGVSRSEEPNSALLPYTWQPYQDNFRFHQIDLNSQLLELVFLIKEFEPEYIVNFAAQGMVSQSWITPEHWYQTNVVGQVKLHVEYRMIV